MTGASGRSRLTDIPYEEWDFEALAEISPGMKPPDLSVVAFFAHHPELASKFLSWNHYMNSKACQLDRVTREMVILRVAVRKRSRYEWAQHLKAARKAGISDEEIHAIASGTATGLAGLLARAVDDSPTTPRFMTAPTASWPSASPSSSSSPSSS